MSEVKKLYTIILVMKLSGGTHLLNLLEMFGNQFLVDQQYQKPQLFPLNVMLLIVLLVQLPTFVEVVKTISD